MFINASFDECNKDRIARDWRETTNLLDDFFDIPPPETLRRLQGWELRGRSMIRSPKERWQQACRARNQVRA